LDVTGGMREKVRLLAKLADESKIPPLLFNAARERNVHKFLTDDETLLGTVVVARER